MIKKNIKREVINLLKNDFIVDSVEKFYDNGLGIKVKFRYKDRDGEFTYTLLGGEYGIDECIFDENENEDIYEEIHDWVDKHIEYWAIIKRDGKEI